MLKQLINLLPVFDVYAHCDVPCGVYDPKPAQVAAEGAFKMVEKLIALPYPDVTNPKDPEALEYANSLTRMILVKEEQARICKEQILILWTDYFKPEHFEKYPDLTDKVLATCKLCSKIKQTIDMDVANDLMKAVDEIAKIFNQTKADK